MKRSAKLPCHLIFFAVICTAAMVSPAQAVGRWDWEERGEAETAFCDQYMPPALELRKTHGTEPALAAFEEAFQRAEKEFKNPHFFYSAIWFEAQVKGGKEDEEWGLAVFEYLYNREMTKNSKWACSCLMHIRHYPLCCNIISKSITLGKTANAREYALKIEDSLLNDRNFDLTGVSYTDQGPVFDFLHDARNRDWPIFMHQADPNCAPQNREEFIQYLCIYAMLDIANIAHISGDWIKAAELYSWGIRYADEYMATAKVTNMRDEVGKITGYSSHKNLSELAMLHGYPEEAAEYLTDYIEKGEGYYKAWDCLVLDAKLERAVIQIITGELEESAREIADQAVIKLSEELHNSRAMILHGMLNKARVYHALGYEVEAWKIVDDLLQRTAVDVNPHHWIRMLDTAIDLALTDGGTRPELEEWLVLALDSARLTGTKYKELPLYEKYAKFLSMHERFSEALLIQQEAVRLSKAMNLPKRLEDNLDVLADYNKELESLRGAHIVNTNEAAQKPVATMDTNTSPEVIIAALPEPESPIGATGISKRIAVDIQPRLSLSAALQGQAAYGRFYVHNMSIVAQQGALYLTGPIDQIHWQNEVWLTASASPVFESVQISRDLKLEAGESCIIDIAGLPLEDGRGAAIQCQWIPSGQHDASVSGSWSYQTAETEKRTAVIDAHEIQNNPFYLIPIHHMVQRIDTTQQQVVDFSVQASLPMRIESYNGATGKLLSVDANGDGDFQDRGDLIVGDDNRNSWPDLVFEKNQKLSSLVMYVQPGEPTTADTELTIRIQVNDEWQTDAIDVIKPYTAPQQ